MDVAGLTILAAAAAGGAAIQELVYWYNLRHQLDRPRYRKLIGSTTYWAVVAATLVGTGLVAMLWYYEASAVSPKEALVFGIGLPLFVKQLAQSRADTVKLGDDLGSVTSTYLRMR
jgi:hypothetical protein